VFARRRRGTVLLGFDAEEARQLIELLSSVSTLIADGESDDPARARLLPDGYRDDPEAAEQFRELTEEGLIDGKRQAIAQCVGELSGTHGEARAEVQLDSDGLQRWLQALNDVRLAMGTRLDQLGVDLTDGDLPLYDDVAGQLAAGFNGLQGMWVLYRWLTELQDRLVELAMAR